MYKSPSIETRNLTKLFNTSTNLFDTFSLAFRKRPVVKALDGVNLEVREGEIFGLLGPNGAGKTTLIKMLCTFIIPTQGSAYVNGYDIVKEAKMVKRSVGLVSGDERSFYWRLTGRQNLKFFGALNNIKPKSVNKKIDYLVDLLEMRQYIDVRFDKYSTGMKQHLAIARSLLSDATILFMDEPTRSLDYHSANKFRSFIKKRIAGQDKMTVFFTTHNLEEAVEFADRIALMDKGIIKACGTFSELKEKIKDPEATPGKIFEHFT